MNYIERLLENRFLKNVLILMSGTALANLITLFFTPILTRIYGPEEYGYLSVFSSIVYTITPAISLTFPIAIVVAKSASEAIKLAKLAFGTLLLLCTLLATLFFIFESPILDTLNLGKLTGYGFLIPLCVLISGSFYILEQWNIRTKAFKTIAISLTLRTSFIGTSQTLLGMLSPKAIILVTLYTVGLAGQTIFLYLRSRRSSITKGATESYRSLIRRYKEYPIYRAPQIVLNSIAFSAPVLFMSASFGTAAAGLYALAFNMLLVPVTLLGKSFGDVFFSEIAGKYQSGEALSPILKQAHRNLLLVGIVPFGLVALTGPQLFSLAFGQEWSVSGVYAQWIAPWLLTVLVSRPSVACIPVLGLQRFMLIHEAVLLVLKLAAIYTGIKQDDPLIAVILLTVVNVCGYAFLILYVLKKAAVHLNNEYHAQTASI